jgi:hypothetical protein
MGHLRDAWRRLRREMEGELESFELLDGSRYHYDHQETSKELFLHGLACMGADSPSEWPDPPEVYLKMCEARDPAAVLERFASSDRPAWFIEVPYERDALIHERRLVPVDHEPVADLSE